MTGETYLFPRGSTRLEKYSEGKICLVNIDLCLTYHIYVYMICRYLFINCKIDRWIMKRERKRKIHELSDR